MTRLEKELALSQTLLWLAKNDELIARFYSGHRTGDQDNQLAELQAQRIELHNIARALIDQLGEPQPSGGTSLIAVILPTLKKWSATAIVSAALLALMSSSTAHAYRAPRDQLALELAVVAAHEGALDNTNDVALVWQVVEARAHTTADRLSFLRGHSPHALGRESRKGLCMPEDNCWWSAQLLKAPDRVPSGFAKGWWAAARAERWLAVRRKAQELVYGVELWRPCPSRPYSWGGAMDVNGAWKERRLVPLGCAGTLNEGFAPAPVELRQAISAAAASGYRKRHTPPGNQPAKLNSHTMSSKITTTRMTVRKGSGMGSSITR